MLRSLLLLVLLALPGTLAAKQRAIQAPRSNWAVLVCTSRFWFNYRHVANTLAMYHSVKRLGIPDSQIILMLADDMPCNARNAHKTQMFHLPKAVRQRRQRSGDSGGRAQLNLYGTDVEVDYRGAEVTVEALLRVLTGRHAPGVPASKRLATDEHSNVFLFMSGHGGDEFLKFQDAEEVSARDLADAFAEMHTTRRYSELLMIADTCQAGTLCFPEGHPMPPGVVCAGSSQKGQNSYAQHNDRSVGVSLLDRFTAAMLEFLEEHVHPGSSSVVLSTAAPTAAPKSMQDFFSHLFGQRHELHSEPVFRTDKTRRPLQNIPITDFFGSALRMRFRTGGYPLEEGVAAEGALGFAPTRPGVEGEAGSVEGMAGVVAGGAGAIQSVFLPWQVRLVGVVLLLALLTS